MGWGGVGRGGVVGEGFTAEWIQGTGGVKTSIVESTKV